MPTDKLQRLAQLLDARAQQIEDQRVQFAKTDDGRSAKWRTRHPAWQVATLRDIATIVRMLDKEP